MQYKILNNNVTLLRVSPRNMRNLLARLSTYIYIYIQYNIPQILFDR